MAEIIATYSPCCNIFRTGDAERGVMHCALPHEEKVVRLVDVEELKAALVRLDRLEVVIHGLRRMAESGCSLTDIIDACEAELPEAQPKNGE